MVLCICGYIVWFSFDVDYCCLDVDIEVWVELIYVDDLDCYFFIFVVCWGEFIWCSFVWLMMMGVYQVVNVVVVIVVVLVVLVMNDDIDD